MKFRVEIVVENDAGGVTKRLVALEKSCDLPDGVSVGLGMTMTDGKEILQAVQCSYIDEQVKTISRCHANCLKCKEPMKRKDAWDMTYRTVYGKYTLTTDRLFTCCEDGRKSFSPLAAALKTHTHPELDYLQAKWSSLISYGQSLGILEDVLPIEGAISLSGMKTKVHEIGLRIEGEHCAIKYEDDMSANDKASETQPQTCVMVADAGRIRAKVTKEEGPRWFGAMVAKTIGADSRCHAYVQQLVESDGERLVTFLEQRNNLSNVELTILTDGGGDVKAASALHEKECLKILDWFHLAMYFQIILQIATRLKRWRYNDKLTVLEEIKHIKWKFWNGQQEAALDRIRLLAIWIGLKADTATKEKLSKRLFDLGHYIEDNAASLVNYMQRHQDGLPISSAPAESAVNQIISHRFVKKQQMRWTPEGAHALLQVRTAVLNRELSDHFNRWYPGLAINDENLPLAA